MWMEPVDGCGLASVYIVPDLDRKLFTMEPEFRAFGGRLTVARDEG